MQQKTERFEMRLDQGTLDEMDRWRSRQSDLPSRAEAVRRLIDGGLSATSKDRLSLSDGEKFIILMLCDIFKNQKIKSDIDPTFVESAIYGGHYWALRWKYSGIFHGHEDNSDTHKEVLDILDMWSCIERGYRNLSKTDKLRVAKDATHYGQDVSFPGFDGNNESEHRSIALFIIKNLEGYPIFRGRDLNSHWPSIATYKRMLPVFQLLLSNLMGGDLNASQIIEILNTGQH